MGPNFKKAAPPPPPPSRPRSHKWSKMAGSDLSLQAHVTQHPPHMLSNTTPSMHRAAAPHSCGNGCFSGMPPWASRNIAVCQGHFRAGTVKCALRTYFIQRDSSCWSEAAAAPGPRRLNCSCKLPSRIAALSQLASSKAVRDVVSAGDVITRSRIASG